ncbi:MAG: hemolysin family protein [Burkholderiaceae bacterium]
MEIFLLFVLILINGVFAMSEIALVTARRGRMQKMADDGLPGAAAAIKLAEEPTRFLSTIAIGITSIGILNGVIGEALLARPLSNWMQGAGIEKDHADLGSTAIAVFLLTYFTIVIGELVPKRVAQLRPEAIARFVARPMQGLGIVVRPFVKLLTLSTDGVLRLLGLRDKTSNAVTEEEIHSLLEEGSDAGVIDPHEHEMARNVFRLDDRAVVSLMIPRLELVHLDVADPLEVNLKKIQESDHSRFPVCSGGWDEVLGMASAKMLLGQLLRHEDVDLRANLQTVVFVPETMNGTDLLASFRSSSVHSAIVVDEYGDVQGMVTLHDLLEAITGEFHTANRDDSWAVQREDGSWLLDGMLAVPELKDILGLRSVVEEERGRYHTLAGMLMQLLGRVPVETDHVEWERWRFEIVDMDGQRIDKVLATAVAEVDD